MGRFDSTYASLPIWAQHAAVSTFGLYWHWLRFGPGYKQFVRDYAQRERFTTVQWQGWKQIRLRQLLSSAADHVPYYRDTWNAAQKHAARQGLLEELPLLGKEPLRQAHRAFLRDDLRPWKELSFHTSGSTGTPIVTVFTIAELRNTLALREVRSARWAGVSFEQPRATFSGRMVEPDPQSTGPFYRFNWVERQAYLSAFHLRRDTAARYVDALRRHHISWLTGYAFSYYVLAGFILEEGLEVPPLNAVITTSEKVTPQMREIMERAYRCRVYEEYSTVENAVFASECEYGRLHVSLDSGIVEILRSDGSPCAPGEAGEVVATCLMRDFHPLIRFRIGDMAAWDERPCPCGRELPVIQEVLGRMEDAVVGPDGRKMVRFHGIFADQPHIREGQIVQESLGRIRVKIVKSEGYGPTDTAEVVRRMHQRLGHQVLIVVETVESIPRTTAGKFKAVVSKLPTEQANVM